MSARVCLLARFAAPTRPRSAGTFTERSRCPTLYFSWDTRFKMLNCLFGEVTRANVFFFLSFNAVEFGLLD